jgi:phage gp36-like protein
MTYCTAQNLIDRFSQSELIQNTNRDNSATTINTTVLDQAIADATAEINGYLTAYLPLAIIPANLVRISCDITRYYLTDDQVIPRVDMLYKSAIDYLKLVAAGKIPLAPDLTGQVDMPTEALVDFSSSPSVFSRNNY